KPLWRQPMMLGLLVLLMGCGGGGGWWAWHEGWLIEAQDRIDGMTHAVVAALGVKRGDSLLGIDLQAARKRLEAIDWVASATVERRLPDTLYVTLKERRAVAIWQNGNEYTLIDRNGRT